MAKVGLGSSIWNTLRGSGTAAKCHANFDRREGGQNVDSGDDSRRETRILRPGAIVLPNLDIDDDPGKPRTRFTKSQVDARHDDKVDKGEDFKDITFFKLAEPKKFTGNMTKLTLRVHANDAKRLRIWEVPKGKSYKEGIEVIGPKAGNEHELLTQSGWLTALPDPGWERVYCVEALTLAGDSGEPPPDDLAPAPPGPERTPAPAVAGGSQAAPTVNAVDLTKSVYEGDIAYWLAAHPSHRSPGDVWLELIHESSGGVSDKHKDVSLFTIAPWIMTWNTLICERVYVSYINGGGVWPDSAFDNHGMVWDLQQACSKAGLANGGIHVPNADSSKNIVTNKRDDIRKPDDIPFYVLDGSKFLESFEDPPGSGIIRFAADRWVQDEFEIGYCYAPHNWLHVVLHSPRGREGLAKFVEEEMAHPGLGVYDGVAATSSVDGTNYGGNLEVSPPVDSTTVSMIKGKAGPAINAHPKAPFGKIILGDSDAFGRQCEQNFREVLQAQMVQPIIPVDTSWLGVGHVDEFLSFVAANDRKNYRLLFASVRSMSRLLKEVKRVDRNATMHAGKYNETGHYDEEFVTWHWLDNAVGGLKNYSETKVNANRLQPIRERIQDGLGLEEADILSIPTYFKVPSAPTANLGVGANRTVAENVGMVNMLVVDDHLMIPQPHGPRLAPDEAKKAVHNALKKWFGGVGLMPPVSMPSASEHFFWARPGESLDRIAMYFVRPKPRKSSEPWGPRNDIMAALHDPRAVNPKSAVHPDYRAAIDAFRKDILDDPVNKGAATPIATVAPGPGHVFSKWMKIKIPDNTVDVFEAYMKSILEAIGNTVHFIENFESYHAQWGEVHCGTNAKRRPPELDKSFGARWWDAGNYDPDIDKSYTP